MSAELEQLKEDIAELREDSKETQKVVYGVARSLEKIENALLDTDYNRNRGALTVLTEVEGRVFQLEKFRDETQIMQRENERKFTRGTVIWTVIFAGIASLQTFIVIYQMTHK
jgi:hypothetical protein